MVKKNVEKEPSAATVKIEMTEKELRTMIARAVKSQLSGIFEQLEDLEGKVATLEEDVDEIVNLLNSELAQPEPAQPKRPGLKWKAPASHQETEQPNEKSLTERILGRKIVLR